MSSNLVNQRVNFATVKNPMPYPDFLDVQLKSFKDFLQLDTPPEKRKNDTLRIIEWFSHRITGFL